MILSPTLQIELENQSPGWGLVGNLIHASMTDDIQLFLKIQNIVVWSHILLHSPSQLHRGDQAGSAHTVKVQALLIPSEKEGLG